MEAGRNVKENGLENNLLELIAADKTFGLNMEELDKMTDPSLYVGRAPGQVIEFIENVVDPLIKDLISEPQNFELKV